MKSLKVLGVNGDRDTCACCGKTGLKRVVWLEIDGGEPVHYGTVCAARAAGLSRRFTSSQTSAVVRTIAQKAARLERLAATERVAGEWVSRTGRRFHVVTAFEPGLPAGPTLYFAVDDDGAERMRQRGAVVSVIRTLEPAA